MEEGRKSNDVSGKVEIFYSECRKQKKSVERCPTDIYKIR